MKSHYLILSLIAASQLAVAETTLTHPSDSQIENLSITGTSETYTTEKNGIVTNNIKVADNSTLNILSSSDSTDNKALTIKLKDDNQSNVIVEKGSTLNIESYFNKSFDELTDKDDVYGLNVESTFAGNSKNISVAGNLNVKSSGIAWNSTEDMTQINTDFLPGSTTNLKGGFMGMYLGKSNPVVNFHSNSNVTVESGNFGIYDINAKKITLLLHPESNLTVRSNWAVKLNGGYLDFAPLAEGQKPANLNAFGQKCGISNFTFRENDGKGNINPNAFVKAKATIIGHDAIKEAIGKLNLVEGSEIQGNISYANNFSLKMDKGTKFFSDELIDLKSFETSGDFYVGEKESYGLDGYGGASKIKDIIDKFSKEDIENLAAVVNKTAEDVKGDAKLLHARKELDGLDGVSGASYTLIGGMKKSDENTLKDVEALYFAKELKNKDSEAKTVFEKVIANPNLTIDEAKKELKDALNITDYTLAGFKELNNIKNFYDKIKYIEMHDSDTYNEVWLKNGEFSFDNATIHMRVGDTREIGEDHNLSTHDKLIFKDTATVKKLTGNVVLHPVGNPKNYNKNDKFDALIELSPKYKYINLGDDLEAAKAEAEKEYQEAKEAATEEVHHLNILPTEIGAYVLEGKENIFEDYDKKVIVKYAVDANDEEKLERKYREYLAKEYFNKKKREFTGFEFKAAPLGVNVKNSKLLTKVGNEYIYLKATPRLLNHIKRFNITVEQYIDMIVEDLNSSSKFKYDFNENYAKGKMTKEQFKEQKADLLALTPEEEEARAYNAMIDELNAITLKFKNELSQAAKKEIKNAYNADRAFIHTVDTFADGIYSNKNTEHKKSNNAWFVSNNNKYTNKSTDTKFDTNTIAAGYDYALNDDVAVGFMLGKGFGDYKGMSYGAYVNTEYVSLFALNSHLKDKHKYKELALGAIAGKKFDVDKFYIEPKLTAMVRYNDGVKYSTDQMDVNIDKNKSELLEVDLTTGYLVNDKVDVYTKYSAKQLYNRGFDVIFNDDLRSEENSCYLIQGVNIGTNVKVTPNSNFSLELGKNFSNKFKSNYNVKATYNIKF